MHGQKKPPGDRRAAGRATSIGLGCQNNEIVKEHLANDEIKEEIRKLVADATALLFENREQSIQKISDAIAASLSRRDDY